MRGNLWFRNARETGLPLRWAHFQFSHLLQDFGCYRPLVSLFWCLYSRHMSHCQGPLHGWGLCGVNYMSQWYWERCGIPLLKGCGRTWKYSESGIRSPVRAGVEIAAAAAASHAQSAPENFLEEKRRCSFSGWELKLKLCSTVDQV